MAWTDSWSPISIFTISELRITLGKVGVKILPPRPNEDQFRDYGKSPLKFMLKMKASLTLIEWSTETYIKKIGGCRPSIIRCDLIPLLGLQLIQAAAGYVLNIQGSLEQQQDETLEEWQLHFCEQYNNFINRVGRIRNKKVQTDFLKALMPKQGTVDALRLTSMMSR